tara:strand:+ start:124 stop:447 length:324 start_codon:yes stop_codon:yes gene_type:complete
MNLESAAIIGLLIPPALILLVYVLVFLYNLIPLSDLQKEEMYEEYRLKCERIHNNTIDYFEDIIRCWHRNERWGLENESTLDEIKARYEKYLEEYKEMRKNELDRKV